MMKAPNKDVEETKRMAMDEQLSKMNECQELVLALLFTSVDGNASKIMTMLDVISAVIIEDLAPKLGMTTDAVIAEHAKHVAKAIRKMIK